MISVIAPLLNEARYVDKFLSSLVHQSYQDFEVIIVDGGSVDGSLNIIEKYKGKLQITVIEDETKNIGYIRNLGAKHAKGSLLFHTSADVMFDHSVLKTVKVHFNDSSLVSLTARTVPVTNSAVCHMAYSGFDLLRWFFTKMPDDLSKYRPGGNFLVVRKNVFWYVQGFPEVAINEDGLLGQRIDVFMLEFKDCFRIFFDLDLSVYHHVKRFEEKGSVKAVLFYLYVFANLFPMLKPLLYGIEKRSGEIFKNRSDLRKFK